VQDLDPLWSTSKPPLIIAAFIYSSLTLTVTNTSTPTGTETSTSTKTRIDTRILIEPAFATDQNATPQTDTENDAIPLFECRTSSHADLYQNRLA